MLPFMFYRYLSKNQDDYLKENVLEEFYDVKDEEEQDLSLIHISEPTRRS